MSEISDEAKQAAEEIHSYDDCMSVMSQDDMERIIQQALDAALAELKERLRWTEKSERRNWTDFERKAIECRELREQLADLQAQVEQANQLLNKAASCVNNQVLRDELATYFASAPQREQKERK
jgi:alkylation response protein AidB-like acyl-CoA dehydrogenase